MRTEIKITCDCNAEGLGELLQTLEKLQTEATPVEEEPVKAIATAHNGPTTDVADPATTASNKNEPEPGPKTTLEPAKTETPTRKEMIMLCNSYKEAHSLEELKSQFIKLDPEAGKFADLPEEKWPELKEILTNAK